MLPPEFNEAQIALITSTSELESLRDEWSALWQRCARATPFQSPAWLLPWIAHFLSGPLHAIAIRCSDTGRLVGLAVCYISESSSGEHVLRFAGAGVSDYNDVLVEAKFATVLIAALEATHTLETGASGWDAADFQQLPRGSFLVSAAESHQLVSTCDLGADVPCPVVALSEERKKWMPDHWRRKLDYDRRRLMRMSPLEFVRTEARSVHRHLDALVRLHGARWAGRGGGVLADATICAFHADAAPALLAAGLLRFYILCFGGEALACYYGFVAHQRAYYYLGGFDPAYDRLGVGNLLVEHAMLEAAREGAKAFDFLRGQETYKYRWGALDEPTFRLQLTARSFASCSNHVVVTHG